MSYAKCGKLVTIAAHADSEFGQRLRGSVMVTAEVLYYIPDHPKLLQTFMWQTLDVAPRFPRVETFLDFWRREIEAVIHSVRVAHGEPLDIPDWRNARGVITMN